MSPISLNQVTVAEPCHVPWDEMQGDEATRFCKHCQKSVHNLSAMPKAQAERLICESAGNLCIRFAKTADGQIATLDYRGLPGKRRWTWRAWTLVAMAGALTAGVVNAAIFGKRVMPPAPVVVAPKPPQQMMMGVMAPIQYAPTPAPQTPDDPILCPRPGSHG